MNKTLPTPNDLTETLAQMRGIALENIEAFVSPAYALGDVSLFADMGRAVERMHRAVIAGEHVGIFADYDCDGMPAAVVILDLFKQLGAAGRVHVYIPDRHNEGYGVSSKGIAALQEQGVTLIITVDVGITALAEVLEAQGKGIDVIVTDHHAPLATLPEAYAVIHPAHGAYPNKDLCGAGVAFMLVRAFVAQYGKAYDFPDGWEKWLLDLVGFATLSDMVPLTGENRVLARYGIMVMKKTRRVGLQALFAANGIVPSGMTEQDLTFTVAPRLNAASRMASPMLAFELLATDDQRQAIALSAQLTAINDQRKALVIDIVKQAHALIAGRLSEIAGTSGDAVSLPPIVVIGDLSWRPAVLGLVANKLQEAYGRSFFVWGEGGDGSVKGSCRVQSEHHAAHLFQALPEGLLLHAGGHQAAGGFAMMAANVHRLERALNEAAQRAESADGQRHDASVIERVANDGSAAIEAPLAIVTVRHYQAVRAFAPFGVGNPEPVFLFQNMQVQSAKKFGKQKDHMECTVSDGMQTVTAFVFFASESFAKTVVSGATVSFLAQLDPGYRGGVRLRIKELVA